MAMPFPGIRKSPVNGRKWIIHLLLILSILLIGFPLYYGFVISTQSLDEVIKVPQSLLPSGYLLENYVTIWNRIHMGRLLFNSAVVAVVVSLGKISIAILSAFAIVFFDFRGKQIAFWMIFITLMLPVPVRIISTYQVVSTLGWVDTYAGLTIPLIASATATFLFRQFYITIPDELVDAAKIDGAGPLRFLWSILLPNSGRQHRRPVRGHVHLRVEPVPLAADGDQFGQHARRGRGHRLHRPHGDPASRMEPRDGGRDDGACAAGAGGDLPPALVRPRPARNGEVKHGVHWSKKTSQRKFIDNIHLTGRRET